MKLISRLFIGLWLVGSLLFVVSCSSDSDRLAERLNDTAYWYHYRSLDSVKVYADSVLEGHYDDDSRAEAMNNLAFYYIGKMQYPVADSILKDLGGMTENQIELLIASVQQMRLCQRCSRNKDYYEYRQQALKHLGRIHEESRYNQHQTQRLNYAETEFFIVSSVYDYYVGKIDEAVASVTAMDSLPYLRKDTIQYIAYLYNLGAGGLITNGTKDEVAHQEYDYLIRCYKLAAENNLRYWEANAMQGISEHILDFGIESLAENQSALRYLNKQNVPDTLLAGNLAERSLYMFMEYGDVYQIAATWRTLAGCYSKIKDYNGAVYALRNAISVDDCVNQSPSLMASLHEKFSLTFSALNDKAESDYHRNKYLDLYEGTRQDRELEARAEQLDRINARMSIMIYAIIALLLFLLLVLAFLIFKRHRMKQAGANHLTIGMKQWISGHEEQMKQLTEQLDELDEQRSMTELELGRQQESYVEQRAKMHLINSLTPLLDRMLHETSRLKSQNEEANVREERLNYVEDLILKIDQENRFLTQWIQLKRGEISLRITTFPLQPLFDVIKQGTVKQHCKQVVVDTPLSVKADKTLTLFMLKTICDNARQFTPEDGCITISATEANDDMVEISVEDTGKGMTEEQIAHLFDNKPIVDEQLTVGTDAVKKSSHGFGLLNCKGIIEKYKKTNALFASCAIGVTSEVGKGTRFFFRLPSGVRRVMVMLSVFLMSFHAYAMNSDKAVSAVADSVYQCNVDGRYSEAVEYARECLRLINADYCKLYPGAKDTLMLIDTVSNRNAELRWYASSVDAPYNILLSVRNELAVSALALHDWRLYHYNNTAYTQLFKECSVDNTLESYCEKMEEMDINRNIAITILVLLLLLFVPLYYFTYYRHVIVEAKNVTGQMEDRLKECMRQKHQKEDKLEQLRFERDRLHVTNNVLNNSFSTIKHETMYYPSRILQLIDDHDYEQMDEVVRYYRAVYDMLSRQAQYNCQQQLPVNVLHDMALRLMAQLSGQRKADLEPLLSEGYEIYHLQMKRADEVKVRVLTQVARDLGEQYNKRRCGITPNGADIVVTLASRLSDHPANL